MKLYDDEQEIQYWFEIINKCIDRLPKDYQLPLREWLFEKKPSYIVAQKYGYTNQKWYQIKKRLFRNVKRFKK
jgi:hypothetical protein